MPALLHAGGVSVVADSKDPHIPVICTACVSAGVHVPAGQAVCVATGVFVWLPIKLLYWSPDVLLVQQFLVLLLQPKPPREDWTVLHSKSK